MKIPYYLNPVLYDSPYLVATPDGYTKHYFVESERFASRIGDGTITGLNTHAAAASALAAKQAKVNNSAPDSIMPNSFVYLRSLPFNWSSHHTTYWQHSDHLGSASWVTDTNGTAYQHLQYMPWGEPLLDQRKSGYTYNSRYTFSGKERDEETGYSYFGARYYNPGLSIWLSVDPMNDKYPSTSPYAYCGNNPVKLVDPNGEEDINFDDWYLNIKNGRIEHREGDNNLLREGLIHLADDNASVSDIEKALSNKGYDFIKNPAVPGGYEVNTEKDYKGWELWRKIPYAALCIGLEIPNASVLKFFKNGIGKFSKFLKTKLISKGTTTTYKYALTPLEHMKDPNRFVPESIIDQVIKHPIATRPDPQGSTATMYYSTMYRNGKLYNIEILYNSKSNVIYHYLYSQAQLGPLLPIK